MSKSLWFETAGIPESGRLMHDLETDVLVVGAGVCGINAALELAEHGRKVTVTDARRIGHGETGHTTSHLTVAIDGGWEQVKKDHGEANAKLVARFAQRGLDRIVEQIETLGFDANRNVVDAWVVSERGDDLDDLRKEAEIARALGLDVSYETTVPWPNGKGGIRFARQARIQPVAYLQGIREQLERRGGTIYEQARVERIEDGTPCIVHVDGGITIRANDVIVAANVPFNDTVRMHTKLWPWRTYAVACRIDPATMTDAMFFDTEDPYHYVRLAKWKEGHVVVIGGEDHRTGTDEEPQDRWDKLQEWGAERLQLGERVAQWSGQIIETHDGLPFVGRNPGDQHVWIGTGWVGQGMTFGAAGGELCARLILGQETPLAALFDPSRLAPVNEVPGYVKRNLEFPKHILMDRILSTDVEVGSADEVPTGCGRIVREHGRKTAVYRRDDGSIVRLSPVCPHMKCDVKWNDAEKSWDCPCHGSRFTGEGELLNGPAAVPLERVEEK